MGVGIGGSQDASCHMGSLHGESVLLFSTTHTPFSLVIDVNARIVELVLIGLFVAMVRSSSKNLFAWHPLIASESLPLNSV